MNTPDDSEPMWEMDELLEETEGDMDDEELEQDDAPSTSASGQEDVPTWEMDELLEETEQSVEDEKKKEEETKETTKKNTPIKTLQTETSSESSSWVTRAGIVYSLSGLFALGFFLYAAGSFDRDTKNVHTQTSIQSRTEKDIHRWLEQMDQLKTSLSEEDVAIQSSTLSGFSSEMQQRPKLKTLISNALKNQTFDEFRRTTRDIGSALRIASTKTKSSPSDDPTNQNKQLVKTFRNDIRGAWSEVKRTLSKSKTQVQASSSTSTPAPSTSTDSRAASSPEAEGPK